MVMVFAPTAKGILAEAVPEATVTPFTFIVALGSWVVGVTVTDVIEVGTDVV